MKKKSKQSEESKSFFSNSAYANIPFQAFAPDIEVPKKMPQDSEVDALFTKLISDYEFTHAKKQMLCSKPINEKWNMYCQQMNEDSEAPSPEYLLKCLQVRPGPEVLAEIAKLLEKRRCSFLQRFIGLNLHQFCLSLLCTYNRKSNPFNPSDIPLNDVITNSLLCLKNFSHTQFGQTLSAYSEAIPYLVESISSSSSTNLEWAVEILISFLADNKNGPIVANIKSCIKSLEAQSKSVWSNFSKELAKPEKSIINLLSVFTNRMLQIPNDPSVRLRVVIAMEKNGYVNAFKAIKADPANKIIEPIKQRFASDILMLKTISPTIMANPFSIKSLSISIKELAQPPKLYHSFLISLYDVLINFKMSRISLLVFLHNFLLIYRYYLSKNDKNKLAVAAASAAANDHPIEIQFTAAKYKAQDSHKQLFQECYYICNTELASLDLSKFCKIVNPSDIQKQADPQTIQRTQSAPNSEKESSDKLSAELKATLEQKNTEIATLKKKLIAVLQENKSMKAENAQRSTEATPAQNDEIAQLKSQIESLQLENQNLKNQSQTNPDSDKENAELKNQVQTLIADNNKLKAEVEQRVKESQEKEAQKTDLSNEIVQLKKKLIAALQEKKTLKTENQQHLTANKEKEDKNNELLTEIDQLKKQVENLVNENTTLKSDSEQQLLSLKDKELQSSEIDSLKQENTKTASELSQLKEQLSQLSEKSQQEVKQLNEKLAQKTEECANAIKDSESLRNEIDSLKKSSDSSSNEVSTLKEENQKLINEIDSLKKSSDSSSNEVSTLKEENQKLTNEIESLKSKVSEKETAHDQSTNELNSIKSQLETANNEVKSLKEQKENLSKELSNAKSQISSKEASIDSIKSQKESLEKDFDKLKAELKQSKENNDSSKSSLENELESLKKNLDDANKQINELKIEKQNVEKSSQEQNSTHQNQVDSLQSQIKSLENSVSDRDSQIEKLNQTLDSQTKQLESASSKEVELNKQISDLLSKGTDDEKLQAQLNEKDNLLSSQKNEMDELRKQIENLNNDASNKNNELKSANDKIASKDQEIVQLKSQNEKDQNELKSKEQEINQLKSQTENVQNELKSKEQEINQLKSQTENAQNELKSKEQEINQLKSQNENAQNELKSANDSIASKDHEINQLKSQNENAQNELKSKEQEIESLKGQASDKIKDADQKSTEISDLKSQVSNLESQLKTANEDLKSAKETIEKGSSASQTELLEIKSKCSKLENDLQKSQSENEERLNSIKSKDAEIESLKSKSDENNKEIEQLKNQLDNSKKEIEHLKSETQNHQQERENEKDSQTQEINTLKSQLEELNKEHQNAKSQLEKLNEEHQSTKSQLEKLNEDHQQTKSQLESANNQISQKSASSEETEKLQSELEKAKKEAEEYKKKLDDVHKESLEIKSQVEDIEKASKASIDKLEVTLLENERLIVEVQSQKDIINQLSLTNQENETNNTQLKDELTDLKNKLESVEKQNSELHSEVERQAAENAKLKKDIVDLTPSQNAQLLEQQHKERVRKISDASLSKKLPPKPLLNPPKTKTCLLKWTKLPDDLIKTSFWNDIDENSVNFNPDFFASTTHYIPQYKFAASNNFLVLTKLDPDSTVDLIRTMNITSESSYDQLFNDDVLDLLKNIVPSEEETEYLSSMEETELTIYEKFMKNLSSIPSLNMRVQFLVIHKNFEKKVEQLKEPFEKIIKGLNDLISSDKIKEIFATILKIGNYSNGGNEEYGAAYGFTLDSISKIRETEIPMFISRNYPDLIEEIEILKPFIDNKDFQLRKASEIIQKYSEELLLCMLEMPNAEIRLKDGDNFWTVFMDFYGAKRSILDQMKELSLDAIKCLNEAILFFGEDENEEFSDFASKLIPLYNELNRGRIITTALDKQFADANKQNDEQQQQQEEQDQQLGQFQHESVAAPIAQIKDTFKNALGKFFTKK